MLSQLLEEVNFDGIVGPTHNFGGLSYGNVASTTHASSLSSPKQGALQGLKKAKFLSNLGLSQGVLPPQMRPSFRALYEIGFRGSEQQVLEKAYKLNPALLAICCSSSFMWTANAATVAPSSDTEDGQLHLTVANLSSNAHRAIEAEATYKALTGIFSDEKLFKVKRALSGGDAFSDEGAANHTRLVGKSGAPLHLYVYGRSALDLSKSKPALFPARQTLEASMAVARQNQVKDESLLFIQQNPLVIDKGVFHNDVISVGNENVFLYHEMSFTNTAEAIGKIKQKIGDDFIGIPVANSEVDVETAVATYLFNSQIVTLKDKSMALIAPRQCEESGPAKMFIEGMIRSSENPIRQVFYFDLNQSMKNGGGPACLRLRVPMTSQEKAGINQKVLLNESLYGELVQWVETGYRDRLEMKDLMDIQFINEVRQTLESLETILGLSRLYSKI